MFIGPPPHLSLFRSPPARGQGMDVGGVVYPAEGVCPNSRQRRGVRLPADRLANPWRFG